MRLVVGSFPETYRSFLFKLYRQAGIGEHELSFSKDPNLGGFTGRVDLLGEKALNLWTGKKGIDNWRGSSLPLVGEDALRAMPTYAPDWLMANDWAIPTVVSDLKKSLNQPPEFYSLEPRVQDIEEFEGKSITFDIETGYPKHDNITMVGLAHTPFYSTVVPWTEEFLPRLKRVFAAAPNLITQNGLQFDSPKIMDNGMEFHPEVEEWDTLLMQHLLEPDCPHDLGFIVSRYTNKPFFKDQKTVHEALYCARDTDGTLQSFHELKPALIQNNLLDLYRFVQVPLAKICFLMTRTGISQDPTRVAVVRDKIKIEMEELETTLPAELRSYVKTKSDKTGRAIKPKQITPWASAKVVEQWLYTTLSLPVQKNAKTGRKSTDKKSLAKLSKKANNPAVGSVRRLRELKQLRSNFLSDKNIRPKLHPRFNPHGTNEGRLSSADPSFQNQPSVARLVYVPPPGRVFIEPDYSSGENRLVAWFSKDKARLERLLKPGFSEHKYHAQLMFGIPHDEVNKKSPEYRLAKVLTHGRGYGMGPKKIAEDNELDFKFVKEMLEKVDADKPLQVSWQRRTSQEAEREGVLTNPFGRKRWFCGNRIYTQSLAFLPASTLADVCFRAMISLMYKRIGWPEWKAKKVCSVLSPLPDGADLHLQVHDSLLFSCEPEIMDNAIEAIRTAMEMPHPELDGFSLPVEMKVGKVNGSWGELE